MRYSLADNIAAIYSLMKLLPDLDEIVPTRSLVIAIAWQIYLLIEDTRAIDYSTPPYKEFTRLILEAKKGDLIAIKKLEQTIIRQNLIEYSPCLHAFYLTSMQYDDAKRLYYQVSNLPDSEKAIKVMDALHMLISDWSNIPEEVLLADFETIFTYEALHFMPVFKMLNMLYEQWNIYRYSNIGMRIALVAFSIGYTDIYNKILNRLDMSDQILLETMKYDIVKRSESINDKLSE